MTVGAFEDRGVDFQKLQTRVEIFLVLDRLEHLLEKALGNRFSATLDGTRQIAAHGGADESKDCHADAARADVVLARWRDHVDGGGEGVVGETQAAGGDQVVDWTPVPSGQRRGQRFETLPARLVCFGRLGELGCAAAGVGDGDGPAGALIFVIGPLFAFALVAAWLGGPGLLEHFGD